MTKSTLASNFEKKTIHLQMPIEWHVCLITVIDIIGTQCLSLNWIQNGFQLTVGFQILFNFQGIQYSVPITELDIKEFTIIPIKLRFCLSHLALFPQNLII